MDTKTIRAAGLEAQYNHPTAKKNNVLFYLWTHPNPMYQRLVNGSYDPYPANECGVLPKSLADLGHSTSGKRVRVPNKMLPRGSNQKASAASVVTACFPLQPRRPLSRAAP